MNMIQRNVRYRNNLKHMEGDPMDESLSQIKLSCKGYHIRTHFRTFPRGILLTL